MKTSSYLIVSLTICILIGCSGKQLLPGGDEPGPVVNDLYVFPEWVTFKTFENVPKTIKVFTTADGFQVDRNQNWINLRVDDDLVYISVEGATGEVFRTGIVTITAKDAKPVEIQVIQSAAGLLVVHPYDIVFPAVDAPMETVTVICESDDWKVTPSRDWVYISTTPGFIQITIPDNPYPVSRDAVLTVSATGCEPQSVYITQQGKSNYELQADRHNINFGARDNSPETVTITTNMEKWDFEPDCGWIEVSKNGENQLLVSVADNMLTSSRSGAVTVTSAPAEPVTINITQEASNFFDPDMIVGAWHVSGVPLFDMEPSLDHWDCQIKAFGENLYVMDNYGGVLQDEIIIIDYTEEQYRIGSMVITRIDGTTVYKQQPKKIIRNYNTAQIMMEPYIWLEWSEDFNTFILFHEKYEPGNVTLSIVRKIDEINYVMAGNAYDNLLFERKK